MSDYWTYRARLVEVVDGDTFDVEVDLGFRVFKKIRVRLKGINTSEIFGVSHDSEEYQTGFEQANYVNSWLSRGDDEWPLKVVTHGEKGKYGRWIADVEYDGEKLSDAILSEWPGATYE